MGFTGEGMAREGLRGWIRGIQRKELYAALWGGDGSAGMRANRGVDSDDEVGSDESSDYDSE